MFRAFWKLLREFQELNSFVNFMRDRWKIMVFSHGAKRRELQKKIWEVKKSEINSKKSGHHNTSISAHLEHLGTRYMLQGMVTIPLPPPLQDGYPNNQIHIYPAGTLILGLTTETEQLFVMRLRRENVCCK